MSTEEELKNIKHVLILAQGKAQIWAVAQRLDYTKEQKIAAIEQIAKDTLKAAEKMWNESNGTAT